MSVFVVLFTVFSFRLKICFDLFHCIMEKKEKRMVKDDDRIRTMAVVINSISAPLRFVCQTSAVPVPSARSVS